MRSDYLLADSSGRRNGMQGLEEFPAPETGVPIPLLNISSLRCIFRITGLQVRALRAMFGVLQKLKFAIAKKN